MGLTLKDQTCNAPHRDDVAVNPNDTEESIWAFLCEAQLEGVEAARAKFLQARVWGGVRLPKCPHVLLAWGLRAVAASEALRHVATATGWLVCRALAPSARAQLQKPRRCTH